VARKKTEQEIAFFCEKTRIEQKNQDFFGDSAAVEPLPNMHLSLSSLLAVGLGGRLEEPFEKNTCPDTQAVDARLGQVVTFEHPKPSNKAVSFVSDATSRQ
jgi:hypothetical protein